VRGGFPAENLRRLVHDLLPETAAASRAASRLEIERRLAEALGLVRSAAELEPIFGASPPGALRIAIEECTRRTECFQLVQEDERRLANYVVREEQVQAFLEFADAAGGPWALHFAGKGGLGKSLLARHLCARVIPSRREVWARVDFDHLDPAYPSRQPWLLLEQLGEQLRLQDPDGRVTKEMEFFDQRRHSLRELASEAS